MAAATDSPLRSVLTREIALIAVLLFAGIVFLPVAIWLVGGTIFGDYAGGSFADFFGTVVAKLVGGDADAWFLVLSPYLAVGALRLTAWSWRTAASGQK